MGRAYVAIASKWAASISYSRAVRAGELIFVSGTITGGTDGKALCPGGAGGQVAVILNRIVAALKELGAVPEQVWKPASTLPT
jgi:enamine deaminase RidA (YjgF/YER057c/UK114 family)